MGNEKRQSILIVDDSLMVCRQIRIILEEDDIEIREAHSGIEAEAALAEKEPDVILLDIVLPDTEGYEICRKVKERNSDIIVVFITSRDSEEDVLKGFSLGACDYIRKPFGREELRSRVRSHLQIKKQKDELDRMNRELQENMERLNSMVYRDALTGLYNRRYVNEKLLSRLNTKCRGEAENVLVMVDVDDFKLVNDRYGHEKGDMVLLCLADIMKNACGDHKAVRWGGEEFLLVLFDIKEQEAFALCENIREEIGGFTFQAQEEEFRCTITMGLECYDPETTLVANTDLADQALYYGKKHGKNCCVWYSTHIEVE